jgi:hypothetical protein
MHLQYDVKIQCTQHREHINILTDFNFLQHDALFLHHILNICIYIYMYVLDIGRWAGHVARMGERRGAYRALVEKPVGRRPLGRSRRRWGYNIKMEVGWEGADSIDLAQDRDRWRTLVYTVMNLRVP